MFCSVFFLPHICLKKIQIHVAHLNKEYVFQNLVKQLGFKYTWLYNYINLKSHPAIAWGGFDMKNKLSCILIHVLDKHQVPMV